MLSAKVKTVQLFILKKHFLSILVFFGGGGVKITKLQIGRPIKVITHY